MYYALLMKPGNWATKAKRLCWAIGILSNILLVDMVFAGQDIHSYSKDIELMKSESCSMQSMEKIDRSVRSYFESNPSDEIQLVVVLDVPAPELNFMPDEKSGRLIPRAATVKTEEYEDIKGEIQRLLFKMNIENVVWLDNAQSFVANLKKSQLDLLIENKHVLEILPNERLGMDDD